MRPVHSLADSFRMFNVLLFSAANRLGDGSTLASVTGPPGESSSPLAAWAHALAPFSTSPEAELWCCAGALPSVGVSDLLRATACEPELAA